MLWSHVLELTLLATISSLADLMPNICCTWHCKGVSLVCQASSSLVQLGSDCRVKPIPASFLPHLKTIRLKLPEKCAPQEFHEALAALNITGTRPTTGIQVLI